jgi:hypothetical protein
MLLSALIKRECNTPHAATQQSQLCIKIFSYFMIGRDFACYVIKNAPNNKVMRLAKKLKVNLDSLYFNGDFHLCLLTTHDGTESNDFVNLHRDLLRSNLLDRFDIALDRAVAL